MKSIRLSSKRQVTLPRALCDEMRVGPGDLLRVEKLVHDGEVLWCLRPSKEPDWFGCLNSYARDKAHVLESIRASIERARQDGEP